MQLSLIISDCLVMHNAVTFDSWINAHIGIYLQPKNIFFSVHFASKHFTSFHWIYTEHLKLNSTHYLCAFSAFILISFSRCMFFMWYHLWLNVLVARSVHMQTSLYYTCHFCGNMLLTTTCCVVLYWQLLFGWSRFVCLLLYFELYFMSSF